MRKKSFFANPVGMDIIQYFETLPWVFGAAITVTLFILFSIAGVIVVRRLVNFEYLKAHHDVAGYVFTNLGVLYAVLLAFTVVNVQQRFDKIKEISEIEASYLVDLYRDAEVFPPKHAKDIRDSIKKYAQSVIEDEWDLMPLGIFSKITIQSLKDVWAAYYRVELATKKQEIWYAESINKLNNLTNTRLARLVGSRESLGTEMWILLILGGLTLIIFFWFFGLESLIPHLLMAAILAAAIAFLLFLIYSLDTAFSGTLKVTPESMERVLQGFNHPITP
jgi:hypothetical protein